MLEIDHLHGLRQRGVARLAAVVVATGAAMEGEDDGPFPQAEAVWDEPGALDIEPDLGVADACPYRPLPQIAPARVARSGRRQAGPCWRRRKVAIPAAPVGRNG